MFFPSKKKKKKGGGGGGGIGKCYELNSIEKSFRIS